MLAQNSAQVLVYRALDQVLADHMISAGTSRSIFAAIDNLKASAAPPDQVRRAEDIAIQIHRLQWALQQRDDAASEAALSSLKDLAADWINTRICN